MLKCLSVDAARQAVFKNADAKTERRKAGQNLRTASRALQAVLSGSSFLHFVSRILALLQLA